MKESLWQRYLKWRLRNVEIVECDDDGLTHRFRKKTAHLQWDDVEKVHAFKRDLVTVDCVCLAFTSKDGIIEIAEDTEGYSEVLERLEIHLGVTPEWMLTVMFPAFEPNLTQIYPVVDAS